LRCAWPIVEAFDGRLIYAGGDDVVALLPADTALACADALRLAFTGREVNAPDGKVLFRSLQPGFLTADGWKDDHGGGRPIPFLVPAADCSVGIAIAHFKAPLQDVVRAAQVAQKRAKRAIEQGGLGRSAVAVTLMKRSGEIIEWGCRWSSGGLELLEAVQSAMANNKLNAKFPHRVIELLELYLTTRTPLVKEKQSLKPIEGFHADAVIQAELTHALDRQCPLKGLDKQKLAEAVLSKVQIYIQGAGAASEQRIQAIIGLMQTAAFANRTRGESNQNPQPKGTA
jgi:hypothetical protein